YMRSYSTTTTYDNKLEILSMPSATSTAGATILATITNTGVTGQNWQEYIVPLPTSTTDDYFGFRLAYNGTTAASSVVLDDIYLEDLETCMYPDNIAISNITSTGDRKSTRLNSSHVKISYAVICLNNIIII